MQNHFWDHQEWSNAGRFRNDHNLYIYKDYVAFIICIQIHLNSSQIYAYPMLKDIRLNRKMFMKFCNLY